MKTTPDRLAHCPNGNRFRLEPPSVYTGLSRLAAITSGTTKPSR